MTTTNDLKARGYHCTRESLPNGVPYCYRVRSADGSLAIYGVSTYQTAREAWREARMLVDRADGGHD